MTRLKVMRVAKGLKQCQVAGMTGINHSNLCMYERGYATPKYQTAERIAEALTCTVSDIYPNLKNKEI